MIRDVLASEISGALEVMGVKAPQVTLEHPGDIAHGDYSTNVALAYAKQLSLSPRAIAEKVHAHLNDRIASGKVLVLARVEIAGPGFINLYLSRDFFRDEVMAIVKSGDDFGKNKTFAGKKVVLDYTNPNPFKVFHIGHLMANAIGEAISRIIEAQGAEVIRVNYQGDIGLHVAKAMWGMLQDEVSFPKDDASLEDMISYINKAYVVGSGAYDDADSTDGAVAEVGKVAREEIIVINKMLFEQSNPKLMRIYKWGRKVSLLNFEVIYKKLGTKFNHYFFESEVAQDGAIIVRDFLKRGVFTESEGAIVFAGEPHGLHTRVFITSQGLPTYEAKEVGLTRVKFDRFNPDLSIVVTANEQNDYFRVVQKALSIMFPYMADKMKHVNHGMLRFATGKMSSRKGNIITGESLLSDTAEVVRKKMQERELGPELKADEFEQVVTDVSVGAIKYSILRQATGGDIIYDFEKSISFEGDSGPYLQYSCVRAQSILVKAKKAKVPAFSRKGITLIRKKVTGAIPDGATLLERLLYRYPEVIERAHESYEPHHIATYLIELSGAFNNFYAHNTIIDAKDPFSPYYVALTHAFATVMQNGLTVLGIRVPKRM